MYKTVTLKRVVNLGTVFPHCDQRILHAPGECSLCDDYPQWQDLRTAWGIAFTGWNPDESELPCPADKARGLVHQLWPGNRPSQAKEE